MQLELEVLDPGAHDQLRVHPVEPPPFLHQRCADRLQLLPLDHRLAGALGLWPTAAAAATPATHNDSLMQI